jgi:putative flippase GtrA
MQLLHYAGLGAIGTAGHYLTLVLLAEVAGADLVLATTVGFAIGASINYLLNYHVVFRSQRDHVSALPRFLTVAAAGALLNATVFAAGLRIGLHYLPAQIVATLVVVAVTYAVNRRWTFGAHAARRTSTGRVAFVDGERNRLVRVTLLSLASICVVQLLIRSALARDELENMHWGQALDWGSAKHPPLFGWVNYLWVETVGYHDLSTYVLQKLNVAVGLVLLYILARRFLDRRGALLAVALAAATVNIILIALKYNGNSALWPIWIAYLLVLHRAVRTDRGRWWVATGLLAAAAVLTKYHTFLLLACSLGWLIATPAGRAALAGWRLWLGVFVGLAVLAPHIVWFVERGGPTFGYAIENLTAGRGPGSLLSHIRNPAQYALTQAVFLCPALVLLLRWVGQDRTAGRRRQRDATDLDFLLWHGPVFGLAPAALSVVSGITLGGMWGIASWALLPIWVIARFDVATDAARLRTATRNVAGVTLAYAVVALIHGAFFDRQADYKQAAEAVQAAWRARYATPLAIVGGEGRYYHGLGAYATDHPDVFTFLDPGTNRRITPGRLAQEGAAIVVVNSLPEKLALARRLFTPDAEVEIEIQGGRRGLYTTRTETVTVLFLDPRKPAIVPE